MNFPILQLDNWFIEKFIGNWKLILEKLFFLRSPGILHHFSHFDELVDFFAAFQNFESFFLFNVLGLLARRVADASDTRQNARSLDAFGEPSDEVYVVFISGPNNLRIYHFYHPVSRKWHRSTSNMSFQN